MPEGGRYGAGNDRQTCTGRGREACTGNDCQTCTDAGREACTGSGS
jgi:hypothetical protein